MEMPQEKRVLRSNKGVDDGVAILFDAMGVDCKPYPVVTAGAKDPFPGWFGTSRKPFSDAPKACTTAEADLDLAEMRAQISQPVERAEVLEFVKAVLPAGAKELRVVVGIPVSGNRIRKKSPIPKKPQTFKTPKATVPAKGFKIPAAPNGLKPVKAPRRLSPEESKVKVSKPPVRRSPRIKNPPKVSY